MTSNSQRRVRLTSFDDLDAVMVIYDSARKRMRASGNATQWVNGYPSRELILGDINRRCSYVIESGDAIIGVFSFILGDDPTYEVIDGEWLNNKPYGTIHRIAAASGAKSVADSCLDFCLQSNVDIRIDTHRDNAPMLGWISRNAFSYCGIIKCADGSPRLAFHLCAPECTD